MDNVDLNSNNSSQSSVTNQAPAFEQPVSKKRLSPLIIILSLIIVILVGTGVFLLFMLPKETETPTLPQQEQEEETELTDVSEYTDIVLVDYDGLKVSVSEMSENLPEEGFVPGLVVYTRQFGQYEYESMSIINKSTVSEENITEYFDPAYDDISKRNIEAEWFKAGAEPWILATSISPGAFDALKEIGDVEYPKTNNVFAVFALSHGQEYAQADNEAGNYQIIVFAIKGDNIIRLESLRRNLLQDLLLSEEESNSCSEEIPDYYTSYDVECLSKIYSSGKYDELLQTKANKLISSFEIAQ